MNVFKGWALALISTVWIGSLIAVGNWIESRSADSFGELFPLLGTYVLIFLMGMLALFFLVDPKKFSDL